MESVFLEFGLIVITATALGIASRSLKQPPLLAYIITGILAGPAVFGILKNSEQLSMFSIMGVAFLHFIVGMHLDFRMLKEVGLVSVVGGILQIVITAGLASILALVWQFSLIEAAYISFAIAFSSTIIVVKFLSDKNDIDTLYGRISIGYLLMQDIVALLLLIFLDSSFKGAMAPVLLVALLKGTLLCIGVFSISKTALSKIFDRVASSSELLFLTGISWCFLVSGTASALGLSADAGALIAGLSLAHIPYRYDLIGKIKPLRDFFIVLFFVAIGSSIGFSSLPMLALPVLSFALFVLVAKPLIVILLTSLFGYKKRTSFMAGITLGQISEFSLILISLGLSAGYVSGKAAALVTWVAIITIMFSAYAVAGSEKMFQFFSPYLSFLERRSSAEKEVKKRFEGHVLLVGYNRTGYEILKLLKKMKVPIVVVDHDPSVIAQLKSHGVDVVFGDITDLDFLEDLNVRHASLVISTDPNVHDNAFLVRHVKSLNSAIPVVVTSTKVEEALELYRLHADYVITPHIIGGKYVSNLIAAGKKDMSAFEKEKKEHLKELHERRDAKSLTYPSLRSDPTYLKDLREKILSD